MPHGRQHRTTIARRVSPASDRGMLVIQITSPDSRARLACQPTIYWPACCRAFSMLKTSPSSHGGAKPAAAAPVEQPQAKPAPRKVSCGAGSRCQPLLSLCPTPGTATRHTTLYTTNHPQHPCFSIRVSSSRLTTRRHIAMPMALRAADRICTSPHTHCCRPAPTYPLHAANSTAPLNHQQQQRQPPLSNHLPTHTFTPLTPRHLSPTPTPPPQAQLRSQKSQLEALEAHDPAKIVAGKVDKRVKVKYGGRNVGTQLTHTNAGRRRVLASHCSWCSCGCGVGQ